jgi:hypothetical protein
MTRSGFFGKFTVEDAETRDDEKPTVDEPTKLLSPFESAVSSLHNTCYRTLMMDDAARFFSRLSFIPEGC